MLNGLADAVLVTEDRLELPGPRVLYVNDCFVEQTGYQREEIIGQTPRVLQGPGTSRATLDRIRSGLIDGNAVREDLLNYDKSGQEFWVELAISRVEIPLDGATVLVSVQRIINDRKFAQLALQRQVDTDAATGLLSPVAVLERLGALLADRTAEQKVAVLLCGLVGLGDVYEGVGFATGTQVLRAATTRLASVVPDRGFIGRLTSSTFAIVLPEASLGSLVTTAERIQRLMAPPIQVGDIQPGIDLSVNVGIATADGSQTPEVLLRNAGAAMIAAQSNPGTGYEAYDEDMQAAALHRRDLRRGLRRASLYDHELLLHFQPVVQLGTGRITSAECLLRWNHPDLGLLGPNQFIPIAESTGLILPVGNWVLREACRAAASWQPLAPGVGVAVNVSTRQLVDEAVVADVGAALTAAGLDPALLCLEITESTMMADPNRAENALARLRELGVQLAVDDFGTGHSSLAYLRRLPVQTVKIDRSFVNGVADDPVDQAIVTSVLTLAQALGLDTIAEGVETAAQRDTLTTLGCPQGQGYLFSRPVALAHFFTQLGNGRPETGQRLG